MKCHRILVVAVLFAAWSGCGDDAPGGAGGSSDTESDAATGGDAGTDGPMEEVVEYGEPYSLEPFSESIISSNSGLDNFHNIRAEVDFGTGSVSAATLVVDLDTTCYPFSGWSDNPPPPGHNWPADCDAFDRNFEFTLDPPVDEGDPPAIELVRAITPFGGPMHFEVDITDIANGSPGLHTLQAHISTWSDGAGQVSGSAGQWEVSARIDLVPGVAPRNVIAIIPLYNGSYGSDTEQATIEFEVPEGTTLNRFEVRATGHGGAVDTSPTCIGPAEEFCERSHRLFFDEERLFSQILWRNDCDTLCTITHEGPATGGFDYCLENPCGAIGSVRAPRANWCPGSLTPPIEMSPSDLNSAGTHTYRHEVLSIAPGGSWRISAVFFAFGDE
jgi:hypothetical protein